jgi:hypothetical protein
LSSLSDGTEMFRNCRLDAESVERILTTIPTYTSGTHVLNLGISENSVDKFNEITGNTTTIPVNSGTCTVTYKGWTLTVQVRK